MTKHEEEAVELIGKILQNKVISESVADIVALIEKTYRRGMVAAADVPLTCAPDHQSENGTAAHLRSQIRRAAVATPRGGE